MKKSVVLVATNAVIVVVIFILLAQSLFLVQRGAEVASAKGQISVQKRGETEFTSLEQGQIVGVGDTVVTKKDGNATFTFSDKTRWKAAPNSQITIRKASVDAIKKAEISQIRLDSGQIFLRMVKPLTSGSSFEIQTPDAVVKVTGTVLSVKTVCGHTEVEVLEGKAQVAGNDGKVVLVGAGQEGITGTGRVEIKKSDCAQLAAQTDLVKPSLEFGVTNGENDKSIRVVGATEAGNHLTINNRKVELRPSGGFTQEFPLKKGHNEFKVQTTDKHGAVNSGCRAVEFDVKSLKESSCR